MRIWAIYIATEKESCWLVYPFPLWSFYFCWQPGLLATGSLLSLRKISGTIFNPLEVQARVRSHLRRYTNLGGMSKPKPSTLTVGSIELDDEQKLVSVDGEPVALTPMEYDILKLLMESPGRVYSSAQIYSIVCNENGFGSESAVAVHIRHLREKIEINPSDPRYLKVVWGRGYKMERV